MTTTSRPQVAIITRTKNRPLFLERSIKTVLNQHYQDWTHIIVNDGGDSAIVDGIVSRNEDAYRGRMAVIHNKKSLGMEAASNLGIRSSDTKYIVILDDDDTWHPKFLDQCTTCLAHKRHPKIAGVVTHSSKVVEKVGHKRGEEVIIELRRESFNQYLKTVSIAQLAGHNIFTINSFVFERDALKTVGLYREDLPVLGDWDFNLRFVLQYEIDVIPSTLSYFHHRVQGKRNDSDNSINKNFDEHLFFTTFLHNEYFRKEASSNQIGLSTAVLSEHYLRQQKSGIRFPFFRSLHWIRQNIFCIQRMYGHGYD